MKMELDRGESWDQLAACADLMRGDPITFDEYFYPEEFRDRAVTKMAKKICQACPVRVECLTDALQNNDGYGLKGGLTPVERKAHIKLSQIPRQKGTDAS